MLFKAHGYRSEYSTAASTIAHLYFHDVYIEQCTGKSHGFSIGHIQNEIVNTKEDDRNGCSMQGCCGVIKLVIFDLTNRKCKTIVPDTACRGAAGGVGHVQKNADARGKLSAIEYGIKLTCKTGILHTGCPNI